MSTYFLSYAGSDGDQLSHDLRLWLRALRPGTEVVRDQESIPVGIDWQEWIASVIPQCDALLFLVTEQSIRRPECKKEWWWAKRHHVPTLALLFHQVDTPSWMGDTNHIDFTSDHASGRTQLAVTLEQLHAEHRQHILTEQLHTAERNLHEGDPVDRGRFARDVTWLHERLGQQQRPERRQLTEQAIRQHLSTPGLPAIPEGHFQIPTINSLPQSREYFRNRDDQRRHLLELLRAEAVRLVVVTGPAGIGKSAMVGRVLRAVVKREKPEGTDLEISGTVYLEPEGIKPFTTSTMLNDLGKLLPEAARKRLEPQMERSDVAPARKLEALVRALGDRRVVVMIDNFERLVDRTTWNIRDTEFGEVLIGLLEMPASHRVTVVLTAWMPLHGLDDYAAKLGHIVIRDGLPPDDFKDALRAMDGDGRAGLRDAPDDLIDKALALTGGNPKVMELLYSRLMVSSEVRFGEIIEQQRLPEKVVNSLLLDTYQWMDSDDRMALHALAIYGQPVSAVAVDYLLQPYLDGLPSAPMLDRLVDMGLAFRSDDLYRLALALVPRQWVLDRMVPGAAAAVGTGPQPYTRAALLLRGAEYFRQKRLPDDQIRQPGDLAPQRGEIDLRTRAGDYKKAIDLLNDVAGEYLLGWGQARVVLDLLEPLEGNAPDPLRRMAVANLAGRTARLMGDYDRAIARYEEAAKLAEEQHDLRSQAVVLTNIGSYHYILGRRDKAAQSYQWARRAARLAKDRTEEAAALGGLCLCLVQEGRFDKAIATGREALKVAVKADQRLAAQQQFKLGMIHVELGEHRAAKRYFEQSRQTAEAHDYPVEVGHAQQGRAEVLLDQGSIGRAIALGKDAARIGEAQDVTLMRDASTVLAMARLQADVLGHDAKILEAARADVEEACNLSTGSWATCALALKGVIALRQGDDQEALDAFIRAVSAVLVTLEHDTRNYSALEAYGLALAGLASLARSRAAEDGEFDAAYANLPPLPELDLDDERELLQQSVSAYRAAREITDADGVRRRARRLLEGIPDPHGILAQVKQAASARVDSRPRPRRVATLP